MAYWTSVSLKTLLGLVLLGASLALPTQAQAQSARPLDLSQLLPDLPASLVQARATLLDGHAKKAEKLAAKWIEDHDEAAPHRDSALLLKARARLQRRRLYKAFETYDQLLDEHPASKLFETALREQMDIARRFLLGERRKVWGFIPTSARTEAIEILDRVVERWPGSALAAEALMMQADFYYQRGRFLEAQSSYQLLVDHYSKTTLYERALLRNAEATHAQYRGPAYDSSCLTDARVRYVQYRARFAEKAAQLGITQRLQRIDWELAEKHYNIADFYRRTHQPQAARIYAQHVQQRWPDTVWAERAAQLLVDSD